MRLLVKTRPGRARTLALGGVGLAIREKPLLPSVEASRGTRAAAAPVWHVAEVADVGAREANPWDVCHRLMDRGLGATGEIVFAEPDIEQRWIYGERGEQALMLTKPCGVPDAQNASYPLGPSERWFGEAEFSQLYAAAAAVGDPGAARLRIAHVDTGFDPLQAVKPTHIAFALQRNFIEGEPPNDATDRSDALIKTLGHGTGTLGILAGTWNGTPLGGAAALEVVPIRIADFVVLFRNSVLACFGAPDHDDDYLIGVLNSEYVARLYRNSFRDARQRAFPQIKIAALRALPVPSRRAAKSVYDEIIRISQALQAKKGADPSLLNALEAAVTRAYFGE